MGNEKLDIDVLHSWIFEVRIYQNIETSHFSIQLHTSPFARPNLKCKRKDHRR